MENIKPEPDSDSDLDWSQIHTLIRQVLSGDSSKPSQSNTSPYDPTDESIFSMDSQIVANALAHARSAQETTAEENPANENPTGANPTGANPEEASQPDVVDLTSQGDNDEHDDVPDDVPNDVPNDNDDDNEHDNVPDDDMPGDERGFATDSSPLISDSDSDDSDSDSDSAKSYTSDIDFIAQELLNRSQAQDLEADADDGEGPTNTNADAAPRTRNEVEDMVLPRPDIVITRDMNLKLLGSVHSLVNTIVTIHATGNTEQFPDVGTPLCLDDGTVLGAISDTFGTAEHLFHTFGFATMEELNAQNLKLGDLIYFPEHLAQLAPVDRSKGYDTSNIYDEELEDGSDFTDDEAEKAHKRKKTTQSASRVGRSTRGGGRDARDARSNPSSSTYHPRSSMAPESLRYDDGDAGNDDGPYNPLRRPTDLGQARSAPRGGRHGSWDARSGPTDRAQGYPSSFAPRGTPADNSNRDVRGGRARDDYRRDYRDDYRRDYRDDHRGDRGHRSGPGSSSLRGTRDNRDDRDRDYRGDRTERRDYDNRRDYSDHGQRDGHGHAGSYGAFGTGYNTGAPAGRNASSFGASFFPQPTPPGSAQFGVGPPPPPPLQSTMGYNWGQLPPSQGAANAFTLPPQPSAVGFMNAGFTNVPPPPPGFVGTPAPPTGVFNFSAVPQAQAQAPSLSAGSHGVPSFTGATPAPSAATSTATPSYPFQFNTPPPGYGQNGQNGQNNSSGQGNQNGQNRG